MSNNPFPRTAFWLAAAFGLSATGCESLASNMWKLNRQSNMDRGDAYFSVPAQRPVDETPSGTVGELEAPAAAISKTTLDQG